MLYRWSDRIGRKKLFTAGLVVFAAVYACFGVVHEPHWLWFLFAVYGAYLGSHGRHRAP